MGDAAGHVAPGGHALRADQLRHIVEGHHIALERPLGGAAHGHAHQQAFLLGRPGQLDFLLHGLGGGFLQPFEQGCEFRHGGRKAEAAVARIDQLQKPDGGTVHEIDAATFVQADHACRDRTQNAVEEPPPRLGRVVLF